MRKIIIECSEEQIYQDVMSLINSYLFLDDLNERRTNTGEVGGVPIEQSLSINEDAIDVLHLQYETVDFTEVEDSIEDSDITDVEFEEN